MPVSGGGEAQRDHTQRQKESAREISDFIFAYRLEEVKYRVWTSHKLMSYGQTRSARNGIGWQGQEQEQEEEPEGFEITRLDPGPELFAENEIDSYRMVVDGL